MNLQQGQQRPAPPPLPPLLPLPKAISATRYVSMMIRNELSDLEDDVEVISSDDDLSLEEAEPTGAQPKKEPDADDKPAATAAAPVPGAGEPVASGEPERASSGSGGVLADKSDVKEPSGAQEVKQGGDVLKEEDVAMDDNLRHVQEETMLSA